jgi:hypothetical protein
MHEPMDKALVTAELDAHQFGEQERALPDESKQEKSTG